MNEETILALGQFCKELLDAEAFQAMQQMFHQQMAADMLNTLPHEAKAREHIYSANAGFNQFVSLCADFAKKYIELTDIQAPDHLDQIDDPSVHNIYEE